MYTIYDISSHIYLFNKFYTQLYLIVIGSKSKGKEQSNK